MCQACHVHQDATQGLPDRVAARDGAAGRRVLEAPQGPWGAAARKATSRYRGCLIAKADGLGFETVAAVLSAGL